MWKVRRIEPQIEGDLLDVDACPASDLVICLATPVMCCGHSKLYSGRFIPMFPLF